MSVTSDYLEMWQEFQQIRVALDIKSLIAAVYDSINFIESKVDEHLADGKFDQIPVTSKQALNAAYQILLTAKSQLLANPDIVELFNVDFDPPIPEEG